MNLSPLRHDKSKKTSPSRRFLPSVPVPLFSLLAIILFAWNVLGQTAPPRSAEAPQAFEPSGTGAFAPGESPDLNRSVKAASPASVSEVSDDESFTDLRTGGTATYRRNPPEPIGKKPESSPEGLRVAQANDRDIRSFDSAPAEPSPKPTNEQDLVLDVRIHGNGEIPLAKIRSRIKTRPNRPFDLDTINEDKRSLNQTGWFVDVKPMTRKVPGGRIVVFELIERPLLHAIRFVGNKIVTKSALLREANLERGDALDPIAIRQAKERMIDFYHKKGFHQVHIEILSGDRATDRAAVFLIDEGDKKRVLRTTFEGNTIVSDARLRTQISTKPGFLWYLFGDFRRETLDKDVEKLTAYYRKLGYFQATIGREFVETSGYTGLGTNNAWVTVKFIINEGPRYKVRDIKFLGNDVFTPEEFLEEMTIGDEEYFNQDALTRDVNKIRSLYGAKGYIFADVKAQPRFREQPGSLDLVFQITEGKRGMVRDIKVEFVGNDNPHTKTSTVLNRIGFKPGDILDVNEVKASERRLKASQLFNISPATGQVPQIVYTPSDEADAGAVVKAQKGEDHPEREEVAEQPDSPPVIRGQKPSSAISPPPKKHVPRITEPPRTPHGQPTSEGIYRGQSPNPLPSSGTNDPLQWQPPVGRPPNLSPPRTSTPNTSGAIHRGVFHDERHDSVGVASTADYTAPPSSRNPNPPRKPVIPAAFDSNRPHDGTTSTGVQIQPRREIPTDGRSIPTIPEATTYQSGQLGGSSTFPQRNASSFSRPSPTSTRPPTVVGATPYRRETENENPAAGRPSTSSFAPSSSDARPVGASPPASNQRSVSPQMPSTQSSPNPTTTLPPAAPKMPPPRGTYSLAQRPGGGYARPYPGGAAPMLPDAVMPGGGGIDQDVIPKSGSGDRVDDIIPIDTTVRVQEGQTGQVMLSAGVNSDAGLMGRFILEEKNFDITRLPNPFFSLDGWKNAFRGDGQRFRLEASPGTQVQQYSASFTEPYLLDSNISLKLSGYYYSRFYREWDEERVGGRVGLGYQWTKDLTSTVFFNGAKVELFDPIIPTPPDLLSALDESAMYGFGAEVVHDTRDSQFLATEGHLFSVSLEQVIGTYNYPRANLDLRKYFMLRERPDSSGRWVLGFRGAMGVTADNTPIYERYYAGGFSSIRGFNYRGISPRWHGVAVGGNFEMYASTELLFPITADDTIRGVAFVDTGTVESSIDSWEETYRVAPGFGLRVTIPMMGPAPIALDFAFPVSSDPMDEEEIFSFYVGFMR
jgi:outer membrane protein insertion porin family